MPEEAANRDGHRHYYYFNEEFELIEPATTLWFTSK